MRIIWHLPQWVSQLVSDLVESFRFSQRIAWTQYPLPGMMVNHDHNRSQFNKANLASASFKLCKFRRLRCVLYALFGAFGTLAISDRTRRFGQVVLSVKQRLHHDCCQLPFKGCFFMIIAKYFKRDAFVCFEMISYFQFAMIWQGLRSTIHFYFTASSKFWRLEGCLKSR